MCVDGEYTVSCGPGFHEELGKADSLTNTSNSSMPLLKLELKSKILARRHSTGQGNIHVDFTQKPAQPMSREEKVKNERRKASNRRSAAKSREKEKLERIENEKLFEELVKRNKQLKSKIVHMTSVRNKIIGTNSRIRSGTDRDTLESCVNPTLVVDNNTTTTAMFRRSHSSPAKATHISQHKCISPPTTSFSQQDIVSRHRSHILNLPQTVAGMDLSDFEGVETISASVAAMDALTVSTHSNTTDVQYSTRCSDSTADDGGMSTASLETHQQSEDGGYVDTGSSVELPSEWDGLVNCGGEISPLLSFNNGFGEDSSSISNFFD